MSELPSEIGSEMEYSLSALYPGHLAWGDPNNEIYKRIMERLGPSIGQMILQGRFYVDVGKHLEYATNECKSPKLLVAQEVDFDETLNDILASGVAEKWLLDYSLKRRVVDYDGNAWGYHKNFMVLRNMLDPSKAKGDHAHKFEQLAYFLMTVPTLVGAGAMQRIEGKPGFTFTLGGKMARTTHGMSVVTTNEKPIVNTRDEPLAGDGDRHYARIHVTSLDPNLNPRSMFNSTAWTRMAIDMVAGDIFIDKNIRFAQDQWHRIAQLISTDPTCSTLLEMADGRTIRARDIQYEFMANSHRLDLNKEYAEARSYWETDVNKLYAEPLAIVNDWQILYKALSEIVRRTGGNVDVDADWQHPNLQRFDLAWSDLGSKGFVKRLRYGDKISLRSHMPSDELRNTIPEGRPRLREKIIMQYHGVKSTYLGWDTVVLDRENDDDKYRETFKLSVGTENHPKLEARMERDAARKRAATHMGTIING